MYYCRLLLLLKIFSIELSIRHTSSIDLRDRINPNDSMFFFSSYFIFYFFVTE